jgi:hypothetical protein
MNFERSRILRPLGFQIGKQIVVCDAGGGTVVSWPFHLASKRLLIVILGSGCLQDQSAPAKAFPIRDGFSHR